MTALVGGDLMLKRIGMAERPLGQGRACVRWNTATTDLPGTSRVATAALRKMRQRRNQRPWRACRGLGKKRSARHALPAQQRNDQCRTPKRGLPAKSLSPSAHHGSVVPTLQVTTAFSTVVTVAMSPNLQPRDIVLISSCAVVGISGQFVST